MKKGRLTKQYARRPNVTRLTPCQNARVRTARSTGDKQHSFAIVEGREGRTFCGDNTQRMSDWRKEEMSIRAPSRLPRLIHPPFSSTPSEQGYWRI